MTEVLQNILENAESFLNTLPETRGCKLALRINPDHITHKGLNPKEKKASIEILSDNEHTGESTVLYRKSKTYDSSTTQPPMMISFLIQIALSDLVSFALGQTIVMFRKADKEQVILVDKDIEQPAGLNDEPVAEAIPEPEPVPAVEPTLIKTVKKAVRRKS